MIVEKALDPGDQLAHQKMALAEDRRKRGAEIIKKYGRIAGTDRYAAAADAIADILLSVAESEREAVQILHAAQMDYQCSVENEDLAAEG